MPRRRSFAGAATPSSINISYRRWNIIAGSDEFGLGVGATAAPFCFRAIARAKPREGKTRHPPVYLYAFAHDVHGDADDTIGGGGTEVVWQKPKLTMAGLASSIALFLYAVSGGC